MTDEDKQRRLTAKRNNERVKLVVSTTNTLAITILGAVFVLPLVNGSISCMVLICFPAALVLHLVAHAALWFLHSED